MPGEQQVQALGEIVNWLEQELRVTREEQIRTIQQMDQLRRQMQQLAEQATQNQRTLREQEPVFTQLRGAPEAIRVVNSTIEDIRQELLATRAEVDNAIRLLRAEADADRIERGEATRRMERAASQLELLGVDVTTLQSQTSQIGQTLQTLLERSRELEDTSNQHGLRLDRAAELSRELEERVRTTLSEEHDERTDVIFERIQVLGEMIRRTEDSIAGIIREGALRTEIVQEIGVWRQEQTRAEARIANLEESAEKIFTDIEKLQGETALLEGRHSGLGERVANMRRDLSEVVDNVRAEFAKYNEMMEKQRRKQIQILEQELRETKFHAFRPPEEP